MRFKKISIRKELAMKKIIVLTGKPGAGKDTRLDNFLIGREEKYIAISPGNMLREEVAQKTKLGLEAESYMDAGELVPDDVINNIMISAIEKETKNVILNGYPRTVSQAATMLENDIFPDLVVNIDVADDVIEKRVSKRLFCVECKEVYNLLYKPPKRQGFCDKCDGDLARREDDRPEVVKNRLKVYQNSTFPVIAALEEVGIEIATLDGDSPYIEQEFCSAILKI